MATFRLSYFWESVDSEGWSENFYWDGTNLQNAVTQMNSQIGDLAALRCDKFRLVDARASDVTSRGTVAFTQLNLPVVGNYAPGAGATALPVNVSLNVQFLSIAPRFMRWMLRGLTSDIVVGREYAKPAGWSGALDIAIATVTNGQYQARHRTKPPPGATYSYSIISSAGFIRVGARKPGRPFALPVGRRSNPAT